MNIISSPGIDLVSGINKLNAGARVLPGGKRLNRPGAFMEPTIFTNLKPGMAVYHEELFGPVASSQDAEVLLMEVPMNV